MNESNRYASLSDEQLRAIDTACASFERALPGDEPLGIEGCITAAPDAIRDALFCELLAIELEWQRSRDSTPRVADYHDRFPDRHDDIERVFQESDLAKQNDDRDPVGSTPFAIRANGRAAGTVIDGRYKLVEVIGEGGMGTVFLADQLEPVRRHVALKLIKSGLDSKMVLARFEAERQALALMDHPNIAKVHDGGTTPAGQPYFVMELVNGVPITQYCDQHRLTVPARLELFVTVCQAVQHAHLKGIIHRDLKPGNVLVMEVDGRPTPKVIDFGVAKATEQRLAEQSLATAAIIVGTPAYMSPEQADPSSMDIDTRTDVYALGVILFELLVGSPPHETKDFQCGAVLEMLRIVRDVDTPRPSTKLSAAKALPNIAANRDIEPSQLTKLLKNDLDWIVLKALEKDRTRRYETASAFAQDIQRYLADEPIEARPPSAGYRLKKFAKRFKAQVIAASLVLFALLAGVIGTTWGMYEAKRQERAARAEAIEKEMARANEATERSYAEAIADFVQKDFLALTSVEGRLDFDDANTTLSQNSTLRDLLDRAAKKLDARTDLDPRTEAKLRWMIGENYRGLGEYPQAVVSLERCVALNLAIFGEDDLKTLRAQDSLAVAYRAAGQIEKALPLSEQTLARKNARFGPEHLETITSMRIVALAYRQTGQPDKALPLFEQVLEKTRAKLGPENLNTLTAMYNLALAYNAAGQLKKALPLLQQTLELQRAKLGPEHPDTNASIGMLASFYRAAGQLNKAMPLLEQNLLWSKATYGTDHPKTLLSMGSLAAGYGDSGQRDKAVDLFEQTLELQKGKLGPDHPDTLKCMNELAMAYRAVGKLDKALPLFAETLDRKKVKLGPRHPSTLTSMINLAWCLRATGKQDEALLLNEQSFELAKAILPPDHAETLVSMQNLAAGYRSAQRLDKSIPLYEEALKRQEARVGRDHLDTLRTIANLGVNYKDAGRLAEAVPLLEEAHRAASKYPALRLVGPHLLNCYFRAEKSNQGTELLNALLAAARKSHPADSTQLAAQLETLGQSLLQAKAFIEAEPLLRECLAIGESKEPGAWRTFTTKSLLGGTLLGQKKYADAEPLLLAAFEGMKQREKANPPQGTVRISEVLDQIIALYSATSKPDEVKKWQSERAKFPMPPPK